MAAPPAFPPGLPLDDRSKSIQIPIVVLITLSSVFVIIRLSVSIKNRNFFLLTDHFLWTGHIIAMVGAIFCYKTTEVGGGKHIWDPMLQDLGNLRRYMKYLWLAQLLNIYGMALVKLSICSYIFMLNFSKGFRILIWASVVIHVGLNFIFPSIILFGECTPYSKHWDIAGTQPGSCWPTKPKVISGYMGAATNILTDVLYTLAPLIYISRVQLKKRTIWGVRIVFLLGLITTTISALKLYEIKALNSSPDPTYTSVNLSIYSAAEVFVGVITACLPPLRKTIDDFLRKILPAGIISTGGTRDNYAMKNYSKGSNVTKESKLNHETDADSDYAILGENQAEPHGDQIEITKTTHTSVSLGDKPSRRSIRPRLKASRNVPISSKITPPASKRNIAIMDKLSQPYQIDLQFRGHVEGLTYLNQHSQPLCHLFAGVPYALPPLGPFRFQKPRSLPACYRYGTKVNPARFTGGCGRCPQSAAGATLDGSITSWDEDCLQNNIWVPVGKPPAEGWPVLFWIHGGFLQFGSPNDLDLRAFVSQSPSRGCIVVAPAYRVNIFGFLASSSLLKSCPDYSANVGFWDQRLALQWTHENISYFGGNASNISIGGYSAGSHSVFHQLAYDLGLSDEKAIIKRALMLSNGPGMQPRSMEEAQDQCDELFTILNISTSLTPSEQLTQLRLTEPKKLIQASHKMGLHQFRAVTDGVFVRHNLFQEINNGVFAHRMVERGLKLVIGECSEEHFAYAAWRPPKSGFDNMLQRLEAEYSYAASRELMSHYFPDRQLPADYENWQTAFGHIYANVQIHALGRGMISALVKHGAGDLIHRYRIEWMAKCGVSKYPKEWGVTHTTDMAIWFWGNGGKLEEDEENIVTESFQVPLSKFLRGEEIGWGTQHGMQIRTLKSDGTVAIEHDIRLEEGLKLWEALKKVGATGLRRESRL
ncbi:Alpha/Beta hydrolase protein [Phaeosphaeriaceae sp. PMI808]|nr:Alpha/Beta hydrolase protein [Phaeosphaeriaceae sp. PMI808]